MYVSDHFPEYLNSSQNQTHEQHISFDAIFNYLEEYVHKQVKKTILPEPSKPTTRRPAKTASR